MTNARPEAPRWQAAIVTSYRDVVAVEDYDALRAEVDALRAALATQQQEAADELSECRQKSRVWMDRAEELMRAETARAVAADAALTEARQEVERLATLLHSVNTDDRGRVDLIGDRDCWRDQASRHMDDLADAQQRIARLETALETAVARLKVSADIARAYYGKDSNSQAGTLNDLATCEAALAASPTGTPQVG